MNEKLLNMVKKRHGFNEWRGRNTLSENLFIWKFYLSSDNLTRWKARRIERLDTETQTFGVTAAEPTRPSATLVRSIWERPEERAAAVHRIEKVEVPGAGLTATPLQTVTPQEQPARIKSFWKYSETRPEAILDFTIYECSSRDNAHEFLLSLLAQFQSPLLTRRDDMQIGDVVFALPAYTIVIFARGNLVQMMRNSGRDVVPMDAVAREFDSELVSKPSTPEPAEKTAAVPYISRLNVAAEKIQVGVGIPLEIEASDPGGAEMVTPLRARASAPLLEGAMPQTRPLMFKIFSPLTGHVYREKDQLLYLADTPGPQDVTVYALNANRGASSESYRFEATEST